MAGKTQKSSPPSTSEPTFEAALEQLEQLVRDMESGEMPLNELIENYEKGTKLYEICQARLDEAHGRIELIRESAHGGGTGVKLEAFEEKGPAPAGEEDYENVEEDEEAETAPDGELF